MDEEQGLVSPIAGGIRGIRRSVSSSIFTGRAVPPPVQPDPQTTSLLSQNSLSLTNVSSQLSSISAQIGQLNGSLETIKQNLAISDQLDQLYHDIEAGKFGDNAKTGDWYVGITSVKNQYPKSS